MEDTFTMDLQDLEDDIEQLIGNIKDTTKEKTTLMHK